LLAACGDNKDNAKTAEREQARNAAAEAGAQRVAFQNSGTDKTLFGVAVAGPTQRDLPGQAGRVWAVGESGTILSATDLGGNWRPQKSGVGEALSGVAAVDSRHASAVGDKGVILTTDDAGANWKRQNSNTTLWLRGVAFASVERGWAVGNGGIIVATTNGGHSWHTQTSGVTKDLYAVAFPDAQHGWVVGHDGTMLATKDGGATWTPVAIGTPLHLTGVTFLDSNNGFAVGGIFAFTTRDGGTTWTKTQTNSPQPLTVGAFETNEQRWAVGQNGTVLASADSGTTWAPQSSPMQDNLYGLAFVSDTGWAVGAGGKIVVFRFPGWVQQRSGTAEWLWGVSFPTLTRGWAVGAKGTIRATTDGGATWNGQVSGTTADLRDVDFVDADHGWAVGDRGTIMATRDGGATWRAQISGLTDQRLEAVDFVDKTHGWATGQCKCDPNTKAPPILATTDGGVTWRLQGTDFRQVSAFFGVAFCDECGTRSRTKNTNVGWVVGGFKSVIGWTFDGGTTWANENNPATTQQFFYDVAFKRARLWAVGAGGVIATGDEQHDWKVQRTGAPADSLFGVSFENENDGMAVGTTLQGGSPFSPIMLITTDGGQTWNPQVNRTPARTQLNDVAYVGQNQAWAVGGNGVIMRYSTNP